MPRTLHIKNLEKYHPGYKDRSLIWSKTYFSMLNADPEFEMLCEVDKWRFVAFTMLELQLKKSVPLDEKYLHRKGFDFKPRKLDKTVESLGNLIQVVEDKDVTQLSNTCNSEYIYFIRLKKKGIIKIGFSSYPEQRFKDLSRQTNDEIEVLKIIHGSISKEKDIHRQFEYCSMSPEWYKPDEKLIKYIDNIQGLDMADVTWNAHLPYNNVTQSRVEYIKKSREEESRVGKTLSPLQLLWNKECSNLSKLIESSSDRITKERLRLKERPLEKWKDVFYSINKSSFCCGQNDRSWKADYDWIVKNQQNAIKVLEGKYENDVSTDLEISFLKKEKDNGQG